jgi:hypothetical protein
MEPVMSSLARSWDRFWFPEVPLERVAIFRIAITAFALIDVVFVSNYMIGYTEVDPLFFDPIYLLRVGTFPVPSSGTYLVMSGIMAISLFCALVGYRARLALAVAAPLYLYHWALFNSWGKVNHGKIPAIFALFVLIVAPAAARLSVDTWRRSRTSAVRSATDPIAGWALRVVAVVIVCAYLFSVYSKLRNTGVSWAWEPVLLPYMQFGEGWAHEFLAANPQLLVVMQFVTLLAEAASVLLLTGNRAIRNVLLPILAMFHLGSYYLLETEFFAYLVCYLVFFDTERLLTWSRERRASQRAEPGGPELTRQPAPWG